MRRLAVLTLGSILLTAAPGQASVFTLDAVTVNLRTTDPGLKLWWDDTPSSDWNFTLDEGEKHEAAIFKIGTKEGALSLDTLDNLLPSRLEVALHFSSPNTIGSIDGVSGAGWLIWSFGYAVFDNPLNLSFGTDGLLQISLSKAVFGLPGYDKVYAKFELLREDPGASGSPTSVPEPASLTLLGVAVAAAAARARSRKFVA